MKKVPRKTVIKIVAAALVLGAIGFGAKAFLNRKDQSAGGQTYSYTRTVTLSKGSLEDSITATGTIESTSVSNVTTTQRYEVAQVYVQVGDSVKEGDPIVRLDTKSIDEQITKIKESQAKSLKQLQENYDKAVSSKDEIWNSYDEACDDVDAKSLTLKSAKNDFEVAKANVSAYQNVYDEKVEELNVKSVLANEAYEAYLAADVSDSEEFERLSSELDAANDAVDEAKREADQAKQALDSAKSNTGYSTYENVYNQASTAYNTAVSSCDNYYKQLQNANAQVQTALDKLNEGVDSEQLDDLYDQRSECILKAKTSGVVTSLRATVGSSVTDSTVATIMDTSSLQLSLSVDEYDIQNLKLGMRAIVDSDAVNKNYDAIVTQIDPTASSSGQSSGFGVTVTVTSKDVADLKIGMNASVTIIVSSTDDVYTLPLDAIETKDDGTSVIYVKNDAGEFEEVEVQVGQTTDYYAEVSGSSLKSGMVVRASANEDEATVESEGSGMTSDFGGFGGGSMKGGFSGGGSIPGGALGGF